MPTRARWNAAREARGAVETGPLAKALDADVLLAYEMNGDAIPVARRRAGPSHRPGLYATDSVKWLDRIWFASDEFDGVFQAHDYRLREHDEPGPGRRMDALPVHALITSPADREAGVPAGEVPVRGTAWGGTGGVAAVLVRVDLGPWTPAQIGPAEVHTRASAGKPAAPSRPGRTRSRAAPSDGPGGPSRIGPRPTSAATVTTRFTESGCAPRNPRIATSRRPTQGPSHRGRCAGLPGRDAGEARGRGVSPERSDGVARPRGYCGGHRSRAR